MPAERKSWIRLVAGPVKLLIFALLCWFIYTQVVSANEGLGRYAWQVEPAWLALAGGLYLLGMLPQAAFWYYVLRRAGQDVTLGESIRSSYISQLGKYVPGKWMVIVLRRSLLHSPVENTVVTAGVFFEAFTSLAVGAAVSALMLVIWHPNQIALIGISIGATFLLGIPTVPAVFIWLLRILRVGRLNPTVGAKFGRLGSRAIAVGWVTIAIGWVVQGLSLWATLRAMGAVSNNPFQDLSLHTTAVSLGVVAGFLSQLPGGLGVREWVAAELMEPHYGQAVSFISAIIFRVIMIVSELVISIILYAAGWRQLRKPAPPAGEARLLES